MKWTTFKIYYCNHPPQGALILFGTYVFSFFFEFGNGFYWFRIFSNGLSWANSELHHPLFSERYGYTKYKMFGKWRIKTLSKY
jgi:hypothetical protein